MQLNTGHPGYDFDMEVLAFVPSEPCCVPISMISGDMGESDNHRVRDALERLKRTYYIKNLTHDHHHCVQATRARFESIKRDAGRYLDLIYF